MNTLMLNAPFYAADSELLHQILGVKNTKAAIRKLSKMGIPIRLVNKVKVVFQKDLESIVVTHTHSHTLRYEPKSELAKRVKGGEQ